MIAFTLTLSHKPLQIGASVPLPFSVVAIESLGVTAPRRTERSTDATGALAWPGLWPLAPSCDAADSTGCCDLSDSAGPV